MNVLVCVKRVPATGGHIALTADGQEIDHLGARLAIPAQDPHRVSRLRRKLEPHLLQPAVPPLDLDTLDLLLAGLEPSRQRGVAGEVEAFPDREHRGQRQLGRLPAGVGLPPDAHLPGLGLESLDARDAGQVERVGDADADLVAGAVSRLVAEEDQVVRST